MVDEPRDRIVDESMVRAGIKRIYAMNNWRMCDAASNRNSHVLLLRRWGKQKSGFRVDCRGCFECCVLRPHGDRED